MSSFSFFLFFMYFLGIQTQKILIHKPKKFSHTQKKTFKPQHYLIKPVPLTYKSQTFLSLPKLSQLFQTPWLTSSTHRHYRHHHNRWWFSSFLSLNDLRSLSRFSQTQTQIAQTLSNSQILVSLSQVGKSLSLSSLYLSTPWSRSWWKYVFRRWVYGLWLLLIWVCGVCWFLGLWVYGVCCIPMLISGFVVYVDLWVCGFVVYVV